MTQQAPSAQLQPGALPAPLQGGLNWLGQNIVRPIQQEVQALPGQATNLANTIGQAVGQQPIIAAPGLPSISLPGSPTISQVYNEIGPEGKVGAPIPGGDILKGKATPESLAGTALFLGTMGMGGEEAPPEEELPLKTGESLQRDMRYKQGTFMPKKGGKIQTPILSQDTGAVDQYTAQAGAPKTPSEEQAPAWPEKPQQTAPVAPKKGIQLPGTVDPIDEVQASSATQNSKAYSVTTPDIQSAYRRNGITDPSQVYPVKQNLYDKIINPALKADTTQLPLGEIGKADGIIPQIIKEMQRMDPTLSDRDALSAAAPMINKIRGLAQSESAGAIQPGTIGLKNILDYKTTLNQSNAVKNLINGQLPITPTDMSTVATRNVLSGLINDYAPSGISQAVKDYGLLEEGFPSYLKAVTKERPPFSLTKATLGEVGKFVPGQPIIDAAARTIGNIAQNPLGRGLVLGGVGGALTAAGIYGLPNLSNALQNKSQTQTGQEQVPSSIHTSTQVPQSMNDVNINEQLPAPSQIMGSDGKPLAISPQDFRNQKSQVDAQVANLQQLGVPVPQSLLQQQNYLKQSDPNTSGSLTNVYQRNSTAYGAAQNAMQLLNTVSPDFFNQFKNYDQLQKNNDPQYAALKTAFSVLYSYNPKSTDALFTAGSKDVAQAELKQAMQQIGYDYFQTINSFTQNAPTGLPQTPSAQPSPQGVAQVAPQMTAPGLPSRPSTGIAGGLPNFQYQGGQWVQQ